MTTIVAALLYHLIVLRPLSQFTRSIRHEAVDAPRALDLSELRILVWHPEDDRVAAFAQVRVQEHANSLQHLVEDNFDYVRVPASSFLPDPLLALDFLGRHDWSHKKVTLQLAQEQQAQHVPHERGDDSTLVVVSGDPRAQLQQVFVRLWH